MTSSENSEDSCLPSKTRSSIVEDNYLKELNEDLKLRKQELQEMLRPLENKNSLLLQKLMSNLEEKQNSLQIMRQIMAGSEESSVLDLIKEAEEMKQNLERKNEMLRKEMEMLWIETFDKEDCKDQLKSPQITDKADSQDGKSLFIPPGKATEENEMDQNDFHGNVIELRIEALKNNQKINDLKLSLDLYQNSEPKQTFFNLSGSQSRYSTIGTEFDQHDD